MIAIFIVVELDFRHELRTRHMIESKFKWRKENSSAEPNTPGKDTPDNDFKAVPAADQPAT